MKAKVFRDGDKIIISFDEIGDVETFLKKVVDIASGNKEPIIPEMVTDLEPDNEVEPLPVEMLRDEEPVVLDYAAPYQGMDAYQIIHEDKIKGFYFLCRAIANGEVPERELEYALDAVATFIDAKSVLEPPYGDAERMKRYCKMACNILGDDSLDASFAGEDAEMLNALCNNALDKLRAFRERLTV